MLLAEPQPTAWDVHFRLFGIPVRISPGFWLANALLGWSFASEVVSWPEAHMTVGAALLIWIVAVLVSIVIHELGHALTYRYFGVASHIVLYQFGGLAIADRTFGGFAAPRIDDPRRQIMISLAGPLAQIVVGIAVISIVSVSGFAIDNPIPFIHQLDFLRNGNRLPSIALFALVDAFIYCSIWWALMNLLPVYPLDGGQISREAFTLNNPRAGIRNSLMLSILTGTAVAIWALSRHDTFLAIMFGLLAYSSFAALQAYMGSSGGFGGDSW